MNAQPDEQQLADDLIALIEERVAPQAVLLQARIDYCLGYLDGVVSPNHHTISHIRRHLTGEYDSFLTEEERPPAPQPVKREPTGPRIYVRRKHDGKQGHIIGEPERTARGDIRVRVQWHVPGTQPVWVLFDRLDLVPDDEVDRCNNGQTGDECDSGENRCELCLADEDNEADTIERSMGLR